MAAGRPEIFNSDQGSRSTGPASNSGPNDSGVAACMDGKGPATNDQQYWYLSGSIPALQDAAAGLVYFPPTAVLQTVSDFTYNRTPSNRGVRRLLSSLTRH